MRKKGSGLKLRMVGFFGIVLYPPFLFFYPYAKKGSGLKLRKVGFFGIVAKKNVTALWYSCEKRVRAQIKNGRVFWHSFIFLEILLFYGAIEVTYYCPPEILLLFYGAIEVMYFRDIKLCQKTIPFLI